ncbi:MAG: AAA family ATPase [Magnetococcales bacterium]|nr:AAA family ATPase [Magnetococcales bacterium]
MWPWPGARWWKFDFHTHTPASYDYGKGPDQATLRQRTPEEWLLDTMCAEVDCVAITDHNTGKWIDILREALFQMESEKPDGFRPLILFPGVELTVHGGFHVLALFEPDTTKTADIDRLLGAVDLDTQSGDAGLTRKGAVEVIEEIVKAGGIALPAHADNDNGLFTTLTGQTLAQVIECKHLFAMEIRDPDYNKPQLYHDNKPGWAEILGSDTHHPSGERSPGSHFTWVKMGKPTLEGVRLALLDGDMSIKRSDQFPLKTNPNDNHGRLYIEELTVEKAFYMGRSNRYVCKFNPWMNALIGGRGTGKSTLVEFLRLALRRGGEWPDDNLEKDFEKYRKISQSRQDDGLLTNDTILEVTYHKNNGRYRILWTPGGKEEIISEMDTQGDWQPTQGVVADRFPVRIFSQKQIFEFARTPRKLLDLIDNALGDEHRNWKTGWQETESAYLSLRTKEREISAGLKDEERIKGELLDVKRRLAAFEQAEHAEILKNYQHRKQQQHSLETWVGSWSGMGDQLRTMAEEIAPASIDPTLFAPEDASNHEVVNETSRIMHRLEKMARIVEKLANHADFCLQRWQSAQSIPTWKQALHDAEENYETLRNKLREEQAGEPNEFGKLLQQRQNLERQLSDMASRRESQEDVRHQAEEKLKHIAQLRQSLTEMRSQFLTTVLTNNRYVQISAVRFGDTDLYENQLRELIDCNAEKFDKVIGTPGQNGLLGMIKPDKPEEGIIQLKQVLREFAATGKSSHYTAKDQRFIAKIQGLPPERLDRLDLWFPGDALNVRYHPSGDSNRLQNIHEGSPGQKTAAMLAFLLSYGEEPLILDQPEDDLDNHLISELIVTQFRAIKQHRQVIVVTHNANIVVNGDAEQVMALAVIKGQTCRTCDGSLQEQTVREEICRIMEGGEEAFERRYRRIAHGGRRV